MSKDNMVDDIISKINNVGKAIDELQKTLESYTNIEGEPPYPWVIDIWISEASTQIYGAKERMNEFKKENI